MIFSVQQGHCLSDAAQCVAVSAGDLSVRGHRWYTAGIWDEIITALVLIEAFIPGVIRAKQTTLGSSKTQLWESCEQRCNVLLLHYQLKLILDEIVWYLYLSLQLIVCILSKIIMFFFGEISLDTIFKFCVGFEKKKKHVELHDGQFQMGLLHDSFGPFHTEIPQYCRRLSITPALLFYKTLLA